MDVHFLFRELDGHTDSGVNTSTFDSPFSGGFLRAISVFWVPQRQCIIGSQTWLCYPWSHSVAIYWVPTPWQPLGLAQNPPKWKSREVGEYSLTAVTQLPFPDVAQGHSCSSTKWGTYLNSPGPCKLRPKTWPCWPAWTPWSGCRWRGSCTGGTPPRTGSGTGCSGTRTPLLRYTWCSSRPTGQTSLADTEGRWSEDLFEKSQKGKQKG